MTEETGDLRALLDRLQAGDQVALGELFSRYRDRLGRMIQFRLDGRLRGRVAASDVFQEAYIDALKRLPHYQAAPDMPFLIWLRWVTMQRLIEQAFGTLVSCGGGLASLPPWVRHLKRVWLWVSAKLVINGVRIIALG